MSAAYARPCTCHPDDNPPVPCAQQYALTECRAKAGATSPAEEYEMPDPTTRPMTPSALESAMAKLRECADKTMFTEVTHEEAAALLAKIEAADKLLNEAHFILNEADAPIFPSSDWNKKWLRAYRAPQPAAEGE